MAQPGEAYQDNGVRVQALAQADTPNVHVSTDAGPAAAFAAGGAGTAGAGAAPDCGTGGCSTAHDPLLVSGLTEHR